MRWIFVFSLVGSLALAAGPFEVQLEFAHTQNASLGSGPLKASLSLDKKQRDRCEIAIDLHDPANSSLRLFLSQDPPAEATKEIRSTHLLLNSLLSRAEDSVIRLNRTHEKVELLRNIARAREESWMFVERPIELKTPILRSAELDLSLPLYVRFDALPQDPLQGGFELSIGGYTYEYVQDDDDDEAEFQKDVGEVIPQRIRSIFEVSGIMQGSLLDSETSSALIVHDAHRGETYFIPVTVRHAVPLNNQAHVYFDGFSSSFVVDRRALVVLQGNQAELLSSGYDDNLATALIETLPKGSAILFTDNHDGGTSSPCKGHIKAASRHDPSTN